jgi:hypothetical protein
MYVHEAYSAQAYKQRQKQARALPSAGLICFCYWRYGTVLSILPTVSLMEAR